MSKTLEETIKEHQERRAFVIEAAYKLLKETDLGYDEAIRRANQLYVIKTHKPKEEASNAIVDWEELEKYLSDMDAGKGFVFATCSTTSAPFRTSLQAVASDIRRFIKKS